MCEGLRETATNLEQAAAGAKEIPAEDVASLESATQTVRERVVDLRKAVDNYHAMLNSVDI